MIGCTLWGGAVNRAGYGKASRRNRGVLAHRVAYAEAHGLDVFTMGGVVRHTCDNPGCVNVDHLILGTHKENTADMLNRGRAPRGVNQHGEPLSAEAVADIRRRYVRGHRFRKGNSAELMQEYSISSSCLSYIIRRERHDSPRD